MAVGRIASGAEWNRLDRSSDWNHAVARRIALAFVALLLMLGALLSQPQTLRAWPPLDTATTVQLPTFGVAIDADGLLSLKTFADPTGQFVPPSFKRRSGRLPAKLQARSPLRKISLVRLEAAVRQAQANGQQPDDAMLYLAGLQRVQYVFYFPREHDIVIAGPAEGFASDSSGRVCGMATGRPTLRLDDLVVALRAFPSNMPPAPLVGCTIDPTPEAMSQLQAFQKTVPRVVPENSRAETGQRIADGLRTALGTAPIRVFGISPQTHCAGVMVEADYRMKLIGIGIGTTAGEDRQLLRPGWRRRAAGNFATVVVHAELRLREGEPRSSGDGTRRRRSSTSHRGPADCRRRRAQGNLDRQRPERNIRAWLHTQILRTGPAIAGLCRIAEHDRSVGRRGLYPAQGFADQAGWKMTTFRSEKDFPVDTGRPPKQVICAANAGWRGSRFVAVAGGGVSISAAKALAPERLLPDKDGKLQKILDEVANGKNPKMCRRRSLVVGLK